MWSSPLTHPCHGSASLRRSGGRSASRLRTILLLLLALLLWLPACSGGGGSGASGTSDTLNQALDTDGNGEADRATVGDWDGDGVLELQDVQAAVDALTDPGAKRIELEPDAIFRPAGMLSAGSNLHGLIELRSDTTLDCRGATLQGVDEAAFVQGSWPALLVALTNEDHDTHSNVRIHIENCVVNGGMPGSYDSAGWTNNNYMGIGLFGVRDSSIVGSRVSDTHHACIYVKNSTDVLVEGNTLERCGAASDVRPNPKQPGVYLFQTGSQHATERITVRGNTVLHAGNALYNTRISSGNSQYQTAWMQDIVFESNYGEDDDGDVCFNLRGPRKLVVRGNSCQATSGIYLSDRNTGYCADNPPTRIDGDAESACLEDVTIQHNLLTAGLTQNSNGVISISDYHAGVALLDNAVIGVEGPAPSLRISLPVRNLTVDTLELVDCASACVRVDGPPQINPPPDERLSLRNVTADGAGFSNLTERQHACFQFSNRLEGALVENISASRCSLGVWIIGGFQGILRGFQIDALRAGYLGTFDLGVTSLPTCDASREDRWLVARNSDGTCTGAPGAIELRCACRSGSWRDSVASPQPGVRIDASNGLLLEDGLVENVDGQNGIVFTSSGYHAAELTGIEFDQPRLGDGVIAPMARGVWDMLGTQGVQATGVVCRPGAVAGACVDL